MPATGGSGGCTGRFDAAMKTAPERRRGGSSGAGACDGPGRVRGGRRGRGRARGGAGLARAGREVVVLERERLIGSHTSARNCEVIHAGIYYPKGSAKARLCVRGARAALRLLRGRGVPHRRLGKIIVATERRAGGGARRDRGGGGGERRRRPAAARRRPSSGRLEPALRGVAGLLSPSTGIIDSHALMLSYQGEIEDAGGGGGAPRPASARRGRCRAGASSVEAESGGERVTLALPTSSSTPPGSSRARWRPAIEGLGGALRRARSATARAPTSGSRGGCRSRQLIYPVPERDGLGTHLTLDLGGRGRFGPDTEWIDGDRLRPRPAPGRRLLRGDPALLAGAPRRGARARTIPASARSSLPPGGPATDFADRGAGRRTGSPGLVNLFGIESPGLTASLAIAEEVLTAAA